MQLYKSESKQNGFTKECRDCNMPIYLHRGSTDRWRAFEPAPDSPNGDEWIRHRCPSALQDADLLSLIAPAGAARGDLVAKLKRLIEDFKKIIAQAEADQSADAGKPSNAA